MRFRPGRPSRRPGRMRLGPRPFGPRSILAGALLGMLGNANRLLVAGRPAEAAPLFIQLALQAEAHNMPRRAAHLHVQAARSLIEAGDAQLALAHARAALNLFASLGMAGQAQAVHQHLVGELRARGMRAAADQLERDLPAQAGSAATDTGAEFEPPAPQGRGRLPAKCPHCGGSVRSDEVEWIRPEPAAQADNLPMTEPAAECPYCGSVLYVED